jgi:hypothetical protein
VVRRCDNLALLIGQPILRRVHLHLWFIRENRLVLQRMRFVLVSTHTDQTTGYAKVAYNLLRQLATMTPKVEDLPLWIPASSVSSRLPQVSGGSHSV